MKKVLLTLFAVLMAVPAFAIEVYNNGNDTTVDLYGSIRGYIGYGWAEGTPTSTGFVPTGGAVSTTGDNMLYGLQNNSRVGVKFKVGQFSGNVEIGANEQTLNNSGGASSANTIGFRHIWGAYDFGVGGKLLVGKTSTPTEMGGWSSDVFDTDGALNGFGGNPTGDRRFQVQWSLAGFQLALVQDDTQKINTLTSSFDGGFGNSYIPRISAAYNYNYKADGYSLKAKIGATYTAVNGALSDPTVVNDNSRWDTVHAFKIVAGVRPTFLGGKMWVSIQGAYGQNEDLFSGAKAGYSTGGYASKGLTLTDLGITADRNSYNTEHGGLMGEVGYNITNVFGVVVGGGYQRSNFIGKDQYTATNGMNVGVDSYAVYFQVPITVNKYLSFHPQVTWYETVVASAKSGGTTVTYTRDDNRRTAVVAGMQMRVTF
ncbi:MAG: hypothetical protein MSA07_05560 [Mucispirillum sp.]|nr:hypothetical protein [Mucispirillum sp.]